MRRSIVLAVGLLVVLSGCNAFPGGEAEPTTRATTHADGTISAETTAGDRSGTEADASADDSTTTESAEAALPPGLSTDGVTDAAALAAAHERALENRSYTYDRDVRVVAANGTRLGRWGQHTQVGAERLRFNHTQTGDGVSVAGVTIEDSRVYTNGSVTYTSASAYRDGYRVASGRGFAATTFSSEQLLADALNASETSVTPVAAPEETGGVSSDGQWYRVRASGESRTFTYRTPNGTAEVNATNVTATALVAPSGFVRNVTYEYDFERGNVSGHRTMTVRYSGVGETTVEVPAWVAEAKAVHANRTGNATETALADALAPGLNESGVTDAWTLAEVHADTLRNRSYTVVSNLTARGLDDDREATADATTRVTHDPTRLVRRSNVSGDARSIGLFGQDMAVWATENGTWYAVERANGTNYRKVAEVVRPTYGSRTDRDTLFVLFSALDTELAGTLTENGTTLHRVNATGVLNPEALASELNADSVRNVSLTALVDERGVVHEYRVAYTATHGDRTTRIERTTRFVALGETSVERPAWVAEARNATA
ncbi:hypothetical protein M0R88_05180 [Halorussus gelatinilyticus]|uniref:Lipoprotein n=1 Tax=Halorussus gelatinilyticus TaxID=2937524 RepID=A0A8U0IL49_9EURY|nr:hypothetical protein [Halorussus gelatinilyticus]UPW01498.1 hypothetical protein M0R88_05180 [Halorussus gelatinilyticus]